MSHLIPWPEIIRQQNAAFPTVPGVNWEARVAALERMASAMKKSGWPASGKDLAGAVAARPAKKTTVVSGRS